MSDKFVVKGGLSIPAGKKLELQGSELDASAAELNVLNTFGLTGINDTDTMTDASATSLASSESIKAYVDAQLGASVLTFQSDDATDNEVDLDDDTLKILGSQGIVTSNTNDDITITLSDLDSFDTDSLSEGSSSLYYTDARARASISVSLASGDGNIAYDSSTGEITMTGPSASETRAHFSASDAGGDGSFTYADGVFEYTGPSAAETRAHFTAGDGLAVADGDFSVNVDDTGIETNSDTLRLKDSGVTLAKMENRGNMTVIGNVSGSAATPAEVSILDEDDMASDSATGLASQQSIKKYVDDQLGASVLTFQSDDATDNEVDLDDDTLKILGAQGIVTSNTNDDITITLSDLDSFDTDSLAEGSSSLYYTDARARASISATLASGDGNIAYDSSTGAITMTGPSASETRAHFSASDAGGDGSFTYADGVFEYTGPSASETRAHFTAGDGLAVDAGDFSVNVDDTGIEINSDSLRLKDSGVTLAKMENRADMTVIGNVSGSAAAPAEVTIHDEDDMSSDSDSGLATQQSIKAYVDSALTASDLDFTSDGGETLSIDLDSETLTVAGGSNLTTSAADNTITVALDNDVTISGDMTSSTITNAEFTVDASGNTDIDGTLNVEGVPTFQAESVHSAGIDCNGTLSMEQNEIQGSADNMLLRAGDGDADYSFSGTDQLAIQADSGIVLVNDVECDGNIVPGTNNAIELGSDSSQYLRVHTNEVKYSFTMRKDFEITPTGSATTAFQFTESEYDSAKIVVKAKDGSGNVSASEVLVVTDGTTPSLVEYAVVHTDDDNQVSMTWTASSSGGTCTVQCNATGTVTGSYELA